MNLQESVTLTDTVNKSACKRCTMTPLISCCYISILIRFQLFSCYVHIKIACLLIIMRLGNYNELHARFHSVFHKLCVFSPETHITYAYTRVHLVFQGGQRDVQCSAEGTRDGS